MTLKYFLFNLLLVAFFSPLFSLSNSFINQSELLFYGRFAEVVEITGNEDTLVTSFHTDLN